MSQRGLVVTGRILGGVAIGTVAAAGFTLVLARVLRKRHERQLAAAQNSVHSINHTAPVMRGQRMATPEEQRLIALAHGAGWRTHDSLFRFGTDADGPYLLCDLAGSDVRITHPKGNDSEFILVYWGYSAAIGALAQPNLT